MAGAFSFCWGSFCRISGRFKTPPPRNMESLLLSGIARSPPRCRHLWHTYRLSPTLLSRTTKSVNDVPGSCHPPRPTHPHEITQRVKNFPQRVTPLRRLFFHQREIRSAKGPFLVADIARISFSDGCHPSSMPRCFYIVQTIFAKSP